MVSAGQDSLPEQMTISMGVYTATSSLIEAEECVKRADTAMYAAKTVAAIAWWSGRINMKGLCKRRALFASL